MSLLALGVACSTPVTEGGTKDNDIVFSSDASTLVSLDFHAEVVAPGDEKAERVIKNQLMFLVGQLNGHGSGPRLEQIALTEVEERQDAGNVRRIRYHAKVPVAWGKRSAIPQTLSVVLPLSMSESARSTFKNKYGQLCNDGHPEKVTDFNFWFYYRPSANACAMDARDVAKTDAKVSVGAVERSVKYPEYDRVWEDGILNVVSYFGKVKNGGDPQDPGVLGYNNFILRMRKLLPNAAVATVGDSSAAGSETALQATLSPGRTILITAALIDSPAEMTPAQIRRYSELSPFADLLMYHGHAGLGANVRALSSMGTFVPSKYQIVFFDNCNTFSYADQKFFDARRHLNSDDPWSSKYLDIVTTAMPAMFYSMSGNAAAMISGLMQPEARRSYQDMLREMDAGQVSVVTGDEDNAFDSNSKIDPTYATSVVGTVRQGETRSHELGTVPAGLYRVSMGPSLSRSGGSAELRLKVGDGEFVRCDDLKSGMNSFCNVRVTTPAPVSISVRAQTDGVTPEYVVRMWSAK